MMAGPDSQGSIKMVKGRKTPSAFPKELEDTGEKVRRKVVSALRCWTVTDMEAVIPLICPRLEGGVESSWRTIARRKAATSREVLTTLVQSVSCLSSRKDDLTRRLLMIHMIYVKRRPEGTHRRRNHDYPDIITGADHVGRPFFKP